VRLPISLLSIATKDAHNSARVPSQLNKLLTSHFSRLTSHLRNTLPFLPINSRPFNETCGSIATRVGLRELLRTSVYSAPPSSTQYHQLHRDSHRQHHKDSFEKNHINTLILSKNHISITETRKTSHCANSDRCGLARADPVQFAPSPTQHQLHRYQRCEHHNNSFETSHQHYRSTKGSAQHTMAYIASSAPSIATEAFNSVALLYKSGASALSTVADAFNSTSPLYKFGVLYGPLAIVVRFIPSLSQS